MASVEDRLDTKKIAFVAFSIALVIVVLIIGVAVLYRSAENNSFQTRVVDQPAREFTDLKSKQIEQLNAYAWVDRKAGVAAVPVDRAMDLLIRDAHQEKDAAEQRPAPVRPAPATGVPAASATSTAPVQPAPRAAPTEGGPHE